MATPNGSNPRESWHPARLIPTVGIKGQEEQERRATSSLLAVMRAVPEFGHGLLKELGAPKSPTIETYTEVRFKDSAGKTHIPDGAIVCQRGGRTWTCLVEVKTGRAPLRDEQVSCYMDSEASGCGGFEDMGDKWVGVRKAAHEGTLRANMPEVRDVAERWEEFTQYLSLGLSQDLGRTVSSPRPRKLDTAGLLARHVKKLAADGQLEAVLRIPDAVGDLTVRADLRSKRTLTSVTVDAPREGRAKLRISWLLRQLADAPADLRIEAAFPNARQTNSEVLADVRENPDPLLYVQDPKREPKAFTLTLGRPMGSKRGKEEGSFVRETRRQIFDFYRDLVQNLKPWQARAPKLRHEPTNDHQSDLELPREEPPPFTSDVRDPGEARDPWVTRPMLPAGTND